MPTIRDFLEGPIAVPRSIEASLPTGLPKISSILADITAKLPTGPALPGGTALPVKAPTEFIKSIEASLPAGLPKLGGGPYREIETEKEIPTTARVVGGGYRGITG